MSNDSVIEVVSGVLLYKKRILLGLEHNGDGGGLCGFTPAGEVEDGEDELITLERKLREEIGFDFGGLSSPPRLFWRQMALWGGRKLGLSHYLIKCPQKPVVSRREGQTGLTWHARPPTIDLPEHVDTLFLRLRLHGLLGS